MTHDPDRAPEAGARLQRENDALEEQVKLLVQTEQRLYRVKRELDRQLERIRALGDFALRAAGAEDPTEILGLAAALLQDQFELTDVWGARIARDSDRLIVVRQQDGAIVHAVKGQAGASLLDHLAAWRGLRLFDLSLDADRDAALPVLDAIVPETAAGLRDGLLAGLVFLNRAGTPLAFLLARGTTGRVAPIGRERLSKSSLTFLALLTNHVESALRSAELTARLREGGRQLAAANARLTESLDDLELTQQQLVQAQKMEAVGRLAGGVAHDFNNLLTVILSHAQFLEVDLPPGSESVNDAMAITEAGERAARITNQLLAFSRKQKRTPEIIDLNVLVSHSAQLLGRLIGEHISLELRTDAILQCVRADASQLEQIVLNLVVNARDAMPDGGALTIETRPLRPGEHRLEAPHVAIVVSDTGHGMDAATCAQVFEPFFTTKGPGHGTGMGLATVYGLVQQNDGSIVVESEPGRGSTFTVYLPAVTDVPAPQPAPVARPVRDTPATILLVEDEASIRDVAARALRGAGYLVMEASDGERALAMIERQGAPVDLVVSDVVMPRLGGLALASSLRSASPDTRVLFMSGYTFDAAQADEPAAFLEKPFTPEVLLERVRAALV